MTPTGLVSRGEKLTYGSVCSGIEAATVAWHPLGWECAFVSEIEAFPRAVLKHRWPEIPLHGDFTTIQAGEYAAIDVLVGGTPCQSFSVAGLRGGLADERGNLALEYLRLADRLRPRWLVWENVPGVLSSNGGRDFGAILGGMVELGYGLAYRTLDAQFFGVPQRRRRVFVVGHLGDWRRAAAVLFERHSLSGNPAPRREAGERVAGGARPGAAFGGNDTRGPIDVATAVNAHGGPHGRLDFESETFVAEVAPAISRSNPYGDHESREGLLVAFNGRMDPVHGDVTGALDTDPLTQCIAFTAKDHGADPETDLAPTLRAGGHSGSHANAGVMPAIAFNLRSREGGAMPETDELASMRAASGGSSRSYVAFDTTQITSAENRCNPQPGDPCHPLASAAHPPAIAGTAVRRLTPRECERLQGFPDDYTLIPWRGGMAPDGPRYKALGNSMAVPVMRWIGQRIEAVKDSFSPALQSRRAG